MYRVGLADDHDELRTAIRLLIDISGDMEIVFTAKDGFEAIDKVRKFVPDVLIMDVKMPELDGISAAKEILTFSLPTRIILISSFEIYSIKKDAQKAGAHGFIHKSKLVKELRSAIRIVAEGGTFFS